MVNEFKCSCGNPQFGFECSCEHTRKFPGNLEFSCEYCGIYSASKPKCNKCKCWSGKYRESVDETSNTGDLKMSKVKISASVMYPVFVEIEMDYDKYKKMDEDDVLCEILDEADNIISAGGSKPEASIDKTFIFPEDKIVKVADKPIGRTVTINPNSAYFLEGKNEINDSHFTVAGLDNPTSLELTGEIISINGVKSPIPAFRFLGDYMDFVVLWDNNTVNTYFEGDLLYED